MPTETERKKKLQTKEKVFLATTALEEFWKKDKKILFLGEWCLRYNRQKEWLGLCFDVVKYPWDKKETILNSSKYCWHFYKKLLPLVAEKFNIIHNKNYSQRYWEIMVGPWLIIFIEVLYERYKCLEMALKSYKIETIGIKRNNFITPFYGHEFVDLVLNDDLFNLQLYTQISSLMNCEVLEKCINSSVRKKSGITGNKKKAVIHLLNLLKKCHHYIDRLVGYQRPIIFYSMNMKGSIIWKILYKSKFKIWQICPISMPDISQIKKNDALRNVFNSIHTSDGSNAFEKIFLKILANNIPIAFIEGYETVRKNILRYWKKFPGIFVSSHGWFYFDDAMKLLAAEMCENGTKLIVSQHGGAYWQGSVVDAQLRHELSICDRFYTNGFEEKQNKKLKPMPHPHFSILRSKGETNLRTDCKGKILYVSTATSRYHFTFFDAAIGPLYLNYLDWQHCFLKSLDEKGSRSIIVRLYPVDFGWNNEQRLKDVFTDIEIDDHSRSFSMQLERCKMIICDNKQTTYIEALARNKPTILFWDKNIWKTNKEAIPYFEPLYRAGILFDNPEKAANKANAIYSNPSQWWQSGDVQNARTQFLARFAIGKKEWAKIWVNELSNDLSLSL